MVLWWVYSQHATLVDTLAAYVVQLNYLIILPVAAAAACCAVLHQITLHFCLTCTECVFVVGTPTSCAPD